MSDKQRKPGGLGRALKLFLFIFVVLLVPMGMDQAEMDPETVRTAGRIAAGLAGLLLIFGLLAKTMKVLALVALVLIAGTLLVSEGQVKAPRLQQLLAPESAPK